VGRKLTNPGPDAVIARVAANQHGVMSLAQLEWAGIHEKGRMRRVRSGRLHRVHRGVYAVGHQGLSEKGWWMAAVLACGTDAVLSHTSAAALWQLLPQRGFVHVTVPGNERSRAGIRVHRSRTLFPSEVTQRAGITVTTPSRTLTDLRRLLPQPQFAAALRKAEFLRLPLDDRLDPDHTRSELEARFLPEERLVVELDGYQAHGGRTAFEADRARDAELMLLGFEVLRFTWRRLRTEQTAVASVVRGLLRARGQ
jgi:Transcriptional regulator, AbiEi antitoxin/Protein of unknown function (DUF559)